MLPTLSDGVAVWRSESINLLSSFGDSYTIDARKLRQMYSLGGSDASVVLDNELEVLRGDC